MNLKLDSDGDLDFTGGNFTLLEGSDEVRQKLQVRFGFFKGEWFMDARLGMPYFQDIMGKGQDLATIRAYFQKAAITCPGVASVGNFLVELAAATRALSVDFEAVTDTGEALDFSGEYII